MLGINNSLQTSNFSKSASTPAFKGDFSKSDIEYERDKKLSDVNEVRDNFNDLADTFEQNNSKGSKKAGKFFRGVATLVGLASTYVFAKYGSKITINTFKAIGKSKTAQDIGAKLSKLKEPANKAFTFVKNGAKKIVENPKIADSKIGKGVKHVVNSKIVKGAVATGRKIVDSAKTSLKSIKPGTIQNAIENIMAASTTASVALDAIAGRNKDKSNLDIALGASGGDR